MDHGYRRLYDRLCRRPDPSPRGFGAERHGASRTARYSDIGQFLLFFGDNDRSFTVGRMGVFAVRKEPGFYLFPGS